MLSAIGCLEGLNINQIESNDNDLIVHDKVPSTLVKVLEEIFKEMEEQHQDIHCENSDSDDNSDTVNMNHSRPF